jgi:MoaA/NifB/PqqE/SkfB family radical SAM enzyme
VASSTVAGACHAPFTSLYLTPHGDVLACCQNNSHPLGNITRTSLLDIWRGEAADHLRDAVAVHDLTLGCRFCAWQIEDDNPQGALARAFDHLEVTEARPAWPTRLEFALSNTCNLECIMCTGEWSSRIRSRREGRPPLPKVYDDAFFEDLRTFLPHLHEAKFLGGEPLLAAESLRVLDLIVDDGLEVSCHLTTNGTQWNPRVERILDRLPVSLAVSLDGVTRETVERVRQGASYDELMANLARYREYTQARGTTLDLTFCLMRQNWHEFGAYLRFADEWGCQVWVNTVVHPSFSPYGLDPASFDEMLATLEAEDERRRAELGRNRQVWIDELERLRHWHRRGEQPAGDGREDELYFQPVPLPTRYRSEDPRPAVDPAEALDRVQEGLEGAEAAVLHCDATDQVVAVQGGTFMGLAVDECTGHTFAEVAEAMGQRNGEHIWVVKEDLTDGCLIRHVVFVTADGRSTYLALHTYPGGTDQAGSLNAAAWTTQPPAWADDPAVL